MEAPGRSDYDRRMMPRRPHLAPSRLLAVLVLSLFLVACAATMRPPSASPRSPTHPVILVSIDGLPASVPGTGAMPTLDAIAREGVRANWLTPSYPTLTFPNHYTLVTGLRPDHHGIVHNNMRDPQLGEFVSKEESAKDGRWWGGEPIWATLQRQGGIAATMFWPGSEAEIAGQRPRLSRRFDRGLSANARVDQVLRWLDLPMHERPQLLTLYFEFFDVAAHEQGARSQASAQAMDTVDVALARLRDGLRARGLETATDLIVVSDHGIADVPREQVRYLDDRIEASAYHLRSWGQFTALDPVPGREAEVERALLGPQDRYACWRKADLPPAWHYGGHPRIPAIVCQAEAGWRLIDRNRSLEPQPVKGEHGFAPEDPSMRAIFVAAGPSFRRGATLPAFDNVDLYPLLAKLLGVDPAPNDGRLSSTAAALR
jgi:predicted AlkP superfamily pyrophosphatase or phosphodiesterase